MTMSNFEKAQILTDLERSRDTARADLAVELLESKANTLLGEIQQAHERLSASQAVVDAHQQERTAMAFRRLPEREAAFKRDNPDMESRFNFLVDKDAEHFRRQGYSDAEAKQFAARKIAAEALNYEANGRDGLQHVHNLAFEEGYDPGSRIDDMTIEEVDAELARIEGLAVRENRKKDGRAW